MGQVCFASEENEKRINELELLLKEQEKAKQELKDKLKYEKERQEELSMSVDDYEEAQEKIEAITSEKKQVFKAMLKERKNVAHLSEEIEDYRSTIQQLEV